jgi:hypothetical protein
MPLGLAGGGPPVSMYRGNPARFGEEKEIKSLKNKNWKIRFTKKP